MLAGTKSIMIAGTASNVGKSLLTMALIGSARRRGLAVAPFKAINLSNNARATEFGEVPTAQYLQAIAAGLDPHPRFSPLLVKFGRGFVDYVCNGRSLPPGCYDDIDTALLDLEGRIDRAYEELRRDGFDLIVVEGMGALAEPHLMNPSPANLRLSQKFNIPIVLVCDDSQGGTYASVAGTLSLLSCEQRRKLVGILINKIYDKNHYTHKLLMQAFASAGYPPVLGSIRFKSLALPEEDIATQPALFDSAHKKTIKILRVPSAANLDEFHPIVACPEIAVRWVVGPDALEADLVVIPGCRDVRSASAWLRETGLESRILERVSRNEPIIGICGGAQLLARRICNAEGRGEDVKGMGLLEADVLFRDQKRVGKKTIEFSGCHTEFWQIARQALTVYEIHHGNIVVDRGATLTRQVDGLIFHGSVLATIYHGLFENDEVARAITGVPTIGNIRRKLEDAIDALASEMDVDAILERAVG